MTIDDEFDFSGKTKLGASRGANEQPRTRANDSEPKDSGIEEDILLEKIRIDGDTQARIELYNHRVDVLIDVLENPNIGEFSDRIIVFNDGASYWLADGFHRYHAYKRLGRKKVPARVHDGMQRDAFIYSRTKANQEHKGEPLTRDDKRRNAEDLLKDEEWGKRGDREISRVVGLSHPTIAKLREEVSGKFTRCAGDKRIVTRGGTEYEQSASRKRSSTKKSKDEPREANENHETQVDTPQPEGVPQVKEVVSQDTQLEKAATTDDATVPDEVVETKDEGQPQVVSYIGVKETNQYDSWQFQIQFLEESEEKLYDIAKRHNTTPLEMLTHALKEGLYDHFDIDLQKEQEKK